MHNKPITFNTHLKRHGTENTSPVGSVNWRDGLECVDAESSPIGGSCTLGRVRATHAAIHLDAIEHNVKVFAEHLAAYPCAHGGSPEICAVVKADAYGHGAVPVAFRALQAGATWLAVALVEEGMLLRDAGVDSPILILSEPQPEQMHLVMANSLRPSIYTAEGLAAAEAAAAATGKETEVHINVDTGMGRVGASPEFAVELAKELELNSQLILEGVYTHFAVADEPDNPYNTKQLELFEKTLAAMSAEGINPPMVHTANSALAMDHPESCFSMIRLGMALYGLPPALSFAGRLDLKPAMSLHSKVSMSKQVKAGQRHSYGLRYESPQDETIATVPIGYADGYRRRLSSVGGEVLVNGRRRPLAGTVTMDQILVSCGADDVDVGTPVVLVGKQGDEEITMWELADKLDTIAYEMTCLIGTRVRREYV